MKQTTLFDLKAFESPSVGTSYDPFWDEIETAPEQSHCVLEQVTLDTLHIPNDDSTVLEQVNKTAPEQCHWVEKYKVIRYHKEHYYYRYVWMSGRKLHHVHIGGGNVRSQAANENREAVEIAISDGLEPKEIEKLIRSWRDRNPKQSTL